MRLTILTERHFNENSTKRTLIEFCNNYELSASNAYSKAEEYEKKLKRYCNSLNLKYDI